MSKLFIFTLLGFMLILTSCKKQNSIQEVHIDVDSGNVFNEVKTDSGQVIYVAVSTMISPLTTFNLYKDLIDYISKQSGYKVEFKQRKTYFEVNELLTEKKLDFAFICTGAYLEAQINKRPIELLAVPVVNGKSYYQAYVIVNTDSEFRKIDDLKGASFAFTDPLSNTGYLYVVNYLKGIKTTPEKFFNRIIFTYAHDYSIQAVKRKLVDGASVDGLVYEYLEKFEPKKIEGLRIINKSKEFGIPPFVVRKDLDQQIKSKLRKVLLNMHQDPEGKMLLKKIMIDKFIEVDESIYK
jgi:phosphonate transport system substrate-binding protein